MSLFLARRVVRGLTAAVLVALLLPFSVNAHSELKSSDPGEGAVLPSPFSGPILLTFSEHLANGSKADLIGPDGATVASATVGAAVSSMTFELTSPLSAGAYQAKWTSIADDGDLLRGIVTFSVAAAALSATPPASIPAAPSATDVAAPAPTSSVNAANGGGGDAALPIIIVLGIVIVGGFYLIRRNRPA